ncbi:MAG: response regulator [Pseudomonadota bacterium]
MQNDFDFGDLFTQAARELVPLAQARGLGFLFDYRGPLLRWHIEPAASHRALQRLFTAAIDILEDGFVFFTAQVCALPDERCRVVVAAAASGHFAPAPAWREVMERLALHGVERMSDEALLELKSARGVCPITRGDVSFVLDESEGSLFSLDLTLPRETARIEHDDGGPAAEGARAWLIGDSGAVLRSMERRLQRLGWATRQLGSVQQATAELQRMAARFSRPALVIAYERDGHTLPQLRHLASQLPLGSQVILAVHAPGRADGGAEPRVDVRAYPFSPAELREITRRAADFDTVSGQTRPAPLAFEQRKRALVVDDNAVNQLVATGMLQVLGFEVDTACDGLEAIDRCMRMAPDLVLMDLHMPGMDGLEATRRLRLLQREGAIPGFPILAATADTTSQDACVAAGMDGHLPKPLNLAGLEQQLRRLMSC